MSSIESRQFEQIDTTPPMFDSIRIELAQYDIHLSREQEAKLKILTEIEIALIQQELIKLASNMDDISKWEEKLDRVTLEKKLQENG